MRGLTVGQVFVMFEGLSQYLVMTSPLGGGDGSESDHHVDREVAADELGASTVIAGIPGSSVAHRRYEDLPEHIRAQFPR